MCFGKGFIGKNPLNIKTTLQIRPQCHKGGVCDRGVVFMQVVDKWNIDFRGINFVQYFGYNSIHLPSRHHIQASSRQFFEHYGTVAKHFSSRHTFFSDRDPIAARP